MLDVRFRGDDPEIQTLWFVLQTVGCEVAPRTKKGRDEGFTDQYGTVRVPPEWIERWRAAGSPDAARGAGPVRADATLGERPALPAGDRRPVRRGRR